jgi:4-hydroxy-3-methylbut-2-enyl diphosphate reductase IspH
MNAVEYEEICKNLNANFSTNSNKKLKIEKTVCKNMINRELALRNFAKNNELIIFVAGKNSSN